MASYELGPDGKILWDFEDGKMDFVERSMIDLKFQATSEALGVLADTIRQLDIQNTALNKRLSLQKDEIDTLKTRVFDLEDRLGDLENESYK